MPTRNEGGPVGVPWEVGGRVEVVEAATEVNGRLAWGRPRPASVALSRCHGFLAEQLGAYLADRPHSPADLVFTMPGGGPLRASKEIVQAMLGHRSATQTLDRYGHLYPSDLDALAERLDRAHAAAAAAELWPQRGPPVVQLSKRPGQ